MKGKKKEELKKGSRGKRGAKDWYMD